ncbi:ASKHA domain-containing protein [Lagierella sp.]|uniref:ASKHA domain-containing protein n=1 Tax=Lagierella sp. TaxID=2849657 RepID=UPI00260BEA99|nr:ASKHA domain-containing protein [Lagierella sp.]
MSKIIVENRTFYYEEGENLLSILRKNRVIVDGPCNGKGKCGKCLVKIKSVKSPSELDKKFISETLLEKGFRLACGYYPKEDLSLEIPRESSIFLKEDLFEYSKVLNSLRIEKIEISRNKIRGFSSVENYLMSFFKVKEISLNALNSLNQQCNDYYGIVYEDVLVSLRSTPVKNLFGIAVDIGSTTLCISSVDLKRGKELCRLTEINKLTTYGADVFTRIEEVIKNPSSLQTMNNILIKQIEKMGLSLIESEGLLKDELVEVVVVGNTTMLSIFRGLDISYLGKSPYIPISVEGKRYNPLELGFNDLKPFNIQVFPCVSAFVGGDVLSGGIYKNFFNSEKIEILIDMGTNGEILLNNKGKFYATSCALGPCLEGMNISCGMRAGEGSIDRVKIEDGKVKHRCIGSLNPMGICGSGIISVVSELVKEKIVNSKGAFTRDEAIINLYKSYLDRDNKRFFLDENKEIYISQKDIRQVQLAKGALLSGLKVLLDESKLSFYDVEKIYIAGQFGSYVDREDILGIGILPKFMVDRIEYIGNSSLKGGIVSLLNPRKLKEVQEITDKITYINLSSRENYDRLFAKSLIFDIGED